jgi:hypothetical protein
LRGGLPLLLKVARFCSLSPQLILFCFLINFFLFPENDRRGHFTRVALFILHNPVILNPDYNLNKLYFFLD